MEMPLNLKSHMWREDYNMWAPNLYVRVLWPPWLHVFSLERYRQQKNSLDALMDSRHLVISIWTIEVEEVVEEAMNKGSWFLCNWIITTSICTTKVLSSLFAGPCSSINSLGDPLLFTTHHEFQLNVEERVLLWHDAQLNVHGSDGRSYRVETSPPCCLGLSLAIYM